MTKRFGGLVAVDKLELEVQEGAIHQHHRPQRRRQDHGVQLHHGVLPAGRWRDLVRRRAHRRVDARPRRRRRHQPHLSEHPPVPQPDGDREHPGRHAHPSQVDLVWRRLQYPRDPRRRGRSPRRRAAHPRLRRPAGARRRGGAQPRLWRAAPARDGPGARHAAAAPDARRADGRHEPARERRHDGLRPPGARRARRHHPAHRAFHAGRDGHLRPGERARSRGEDRRRDACRDPDRRARHRGLSRHDPKAADSGGRRLDRTTCNSMAAPLLDVRNLHVHYGKIHALRGVSLRSARTRS